MLTARCCGGESAGAGDHVSKGETAEEESGISPQRDGCGSPTTDDGAQGTPGEQTSVAYKAAGLGVPADPRGQCALAAQTVQHEGEHHPLPQEHQAAQVIQK